MSDKVLITGLGSYPAASAHAMREENPDEVYVICSEWQRNHIAENAGYKQRNEDVIREVANDVNTTVRFLECDIFEPESVEEMITDVIDKKMEENKDIIISYASGSAVTRLTLGVISIFASKSYDDIKLIYAIKYEDEGPVINTDHTENYNNLFKRLKRKYS